MPGKSPIVRVLALVLLILAGQSPGRLARADMFTLLRRRHLRPPGRLR